MSPYRDPIAEAAAPVDDVRHAASKSRPPGPSKADPPNPCRPPGPLWRLFALRFAYARIRRHGAGPTAPRRAPCADCSAPAKSWAAKA